MSSSEAREKGLGSRFVDPVKLMIAMVHMIESAVRWRLDL